MGLQMTANYFAYSLDMRTRCGTIHIGHRINGAAPHCRKKETEMAKIWAIDDGEDSLMDALIGVADNNETFCDECRHYDGKGVKCKAFPDGIPAKVWAGIVAHTRPMPGQTNKVVFERQSS